MTTKQTCRREESTAIGLRTSIKIMNQWGAREDQISSVLGISSEARSEITQGKHSCVELNDEQMNRISYVLNIHAALRRLFENQKNVTGFVSMPNHHAAFNGKTPLDVMVESGIFGLYLTMVHIGTRLEENWEPASINQLA